MKWIVMLLGGYTLYYLVLIVFDALKNSAPMADDEDTQIIPVDDAEFIKFSGKENGAACRCTQGVHE